jgi:hypothetical protein
MKFCSVLWMCLVAMLALGCSAGVEDENLGESQEALACSYPTGSVGNVTGTGTITQFTVTGAKTMSATYTAASGWGSSGSFVWDPSSSTSMSGGWSGTLLTKVSFYACGGGSLCMVLNPGLADEASVVFAAGGTGAPVGSLIEMDGGVKKIEVVTTASGNYRALRFSGLHGGAQVARDRTIPSSGGC